jgi:hypothetical protein
MIHFTRLPRLCPKIHLSTPTRGSGFLNTSGLPLTTCCTPSCATVTCCFEVPANQTTSSAKGSSGSSTGVRVGWCACFPRHTARQTSLGPGRLSIRKIGGYRSSCGVRGGVEVGHYGWDTTRRKHHSNSLRLRRDIGGQMTLALPPMDGDGSRLSTFFFFPYISFGVYESLI